LNTGNKAFFEESVPLFDHPDLTTLRMHIKPCLQIFSITIFYGKFFAYTKILKTCTNFSPVPLLFETVVF
jgi:hypothetical protein